MSDAIFCSCRWSDAWRCAVQQGIASVSCSCACHRYVHASADPRPGGTPGEPYHALRSLLARWDCTVDDAPMFFAVHANELRELFAEVARLTGELATERALLDWIEANTRPENKYGGTLVAVTDGVWEIGETLSAGFNGFSDGEGPTLRAAIDAARARTTGTEERT